MRYRKIPSETIRRLPTYFRALHYSADESKVNISSQDLAESLGLNPWQIRKDFSYFGDFGTPGVGYNIEKLIKHIKKILKLHVVRKAALVGVGNLGSAILTYPGFEVYGFEVAAAFDSNPKKIGKKIEDVTIEAVSKLKTLKRRKINVGIIATPRDVTQEVADMLVEAGVKGILNFSPCRIAVPSKVKVITIDIATDLARLAYYMPSN